MASFYNQYPSLQLFTLRLIYLLLCVYGYRTNSKQIFYIYRYKIVIIRNIVFKMDRLHTYKFGTWQIDLIIEGTCKLNRQLFLLLLLNGI